MKNPFLEVLKEINFLKIWGSQILSQITINLINFVIVVQIFEATHSNVAVSLVWFFYAIPAVLLGPFSGTLVDIFSKRKILMFTNFIQATVVLCYLLVKQKIWPIYSIVFLYSLVNQLYLPAESSTLPWVVPKKLLPAANSLFLFTVYGALLLGFGFSGPLMRLIGRESPFMLGSFFLFTASILVSLLPQEKKKEKIKSIKFFLLRVKEGYLFIKSQPLILFPLFLFVFSQVIIGIIAVLGPSLATEVFLIDLLDIGPLLILPMGIGAVGGSVFTTFFLKRKVRKKKFISFALILASFSIFSTATLASLAGRLSSLLGIIITFFLGISIVMVLIPVQTILQEKTPEDKRGRVFGVLGFSITLASVLPVLFAATLADVLGIRFVLLIVSFMLFIVWLFSLKEPYEIFSNNRS